MKQRPKAFRQTGPDEIIARIGPPDHPLPYVFFAADHYFKKGGGIRQFVLSAVPTKRTDELRRLLQSARSYFVTAAIFSLGINLLYLAGPLYMLQVYDRVISSASEVTLVMLSIALVMAFIALAGLDTVRARVLTRASIRLDQKIAARVMTAIINRSSNTGDARSQLLRDFDTFRQFVTGTGVHAIFDLPWAPIYIGVIFVLHPALGAFALGCAVLLVLMALLNEWIVKPPLTESNQAGFTQLQLHRNEPAQYRGGARDGHDGRPAEALGP